MKLVLTLTGMKISWTCDSLIAKRKSSRVINAWLIYATIFQFIISAYQSNRCTSDPPSWLSGKAYH
jgi:hypothetical protein